MTFTTQRDYFTEVARGNVPEFRDEHQLGYNDDIDTGTSPETVWNPGGNMTFLTVAETMDIVSDSVEDASPSGTGARTVCFKGLDANFDEVEEIVTMAGLTPVTTVNSYIRRQHVFVILSGTNESNVGTITVTSTSSASVQAQLDPDRGEDGSSCFTIPANHLGFMSHINVGVNSREGSGGIKEARVEMYKRLPGESWRIVKMFSARSDGTSTSPDLSFSTPTIFPAKTDIKWIADADVNNTSVNVQYDMILVNTV
jgi:hypothetical protein